MTPTRAVRAITRANAGEIEYVTKDELTAQQALDLEVVLDAHNAADNSPKQAAQLQKAADILALKAAIAAGIKAGDLPLIARLLLAVAD